MNQKGLGLGVILGFPLILLVGLMTFVAVDEESATACTPTGTTVLQAVGVDPTSVPQGPIAGYGHDQLVNAAHILKAAADQGLTRRDQQIGVMTAMGESGLRVLDHGDQAGADSRGLFQQRDNGAWGSLADRMDPYISSSNFFTVLATITDRESLEPSVAANRVQRNADPYHYRPYWAPAGLVIDALAGGTSAVGSVAPVVATSSVTSAYDLGPVQSHLAQLVNVLGPRFGIQSVGGYRASATDPDGHPAGLAADFMVPLNAQGRARGDALATYAMSNAAALKVDYILWRQRIWSTTRAAEGWRPMEDRGSATENHEDHVHINVLPSPGGTAGTVDASTLDGAICATNVSMSGAWVAPILDAPISSPYGNRTHPVTGEASFHDGVDYDAPCGTQIGAASGGVVVKAGPDPIYGHQVIIDHGGGILTRYGHMTASGVLVTVGAQVTTGHVIALVGSEGLSTGCHLHFTVEVDGQTVDPVAFLANPPASGSLTGGISIAHANIKASLSGPQFRSDLTKTVTGAPDLVSLNEMSPRGDTELAPAGYAAFRAPVTAPASQTRSTAVLWRTDRWTLVEGGRELLVAVGPQKWDAGRSATWATVRDAEGVQVSMVSVHHMINPAVYGPNPQRQQIYAAGMTRLQGLVTTLAARGPVFVAGDFNSQWAANDPWGPRVLLGALGMANTMDGLARQATHEGGGTIDYIFFQPTATTFSGQQITDLNSDHHAMLATFQG